MKSISIVEHTVINHSGFIGEHTIKLVPNKTTVIFGVNGAGKTSLLNALYGSVMIYIGHIVGANYANINLSNASISIGKSETDILSKNLALNDLGGFSGLLNFKSLVNLTLRQKMGVLNPPKSYRTKFLLKENNSIEEFLIGINISINNSTFFG